MKKNPLYLQFVNACDLISNSQANLEVRWAIVAVRKIFISLFPSAENLKMT